MGNKRRLAKNLFRALASEGLSKRKTASEGLPKRKAALQLPLGFPFSGKMSDALYGKTITSLLSQDNGRSLVSLVEKNQHLVFTLPPRYKATLIHQLHLRSVKTNGSFVSSEQASLDFWLIERILFSTVGQDLTILKLSLDGLALGDDLFSPSSPHNHRDIRRKALFGRDEAGAGVGGTGGDELELSSPSAAAHPVVVSAAGLKGVVNVHHDLLALLKSFALLPPSGTGSNAAIPYPPSFTSSGERESNTTGLPLVTGKERAEKLLEHFRIQSIVALKQWNAERLAQEKERYIRRAVDQMMKKKTKGGESVVPLATVMVQVKPFWPIKLFSDFDDTMAPKLWDKSFPSTVPSGNSSGSSTAVGGGGPLNIGGAVPYPGVSAFISALTGMHMHPATAIKPPPTSIEGGSKVETAPLSTSSEVAPLMGLSASQRLPLVSSPLAVKSSDSHTTRDIRTADQGGSHAPGGVVRRKNLQSSSSLETPPPVPPSARRLPLSEPNDTDNTTASVEAVEESIQAFSLAEFLSSGGATTTDPAASPMTTVDGSTDVGSTDGLLPSPKHGSAGTAHTKRLPIPSSVSTTTSLPGTATQSSAGEQSPQRPSARRDGAPWNGPGNITTSDDLPSLLKVDPGSLSFAVSEEEILSRLPREGEEGEASSAVSEKTTKRGGVGDGEVEEDDEEGPDSWIGHFGISGTVYLSARPAMLKTTTLQTVSSTVLNGRPPRAILCGTVMTSFTNRSMATRKFDNFLAYSRLYPEFRVVWLGDSGQGDIEAGRKMLELYKQWHKQAQEEAGLATEGAIGREDQHPLLWWPPPPPLVLIHDIATSSGSASSSSSSTSASGPTLAVAAAAASATASSSTTANSTTSAIPIGASGDVPSESGRSTSSSGSKRLTPPLERARLRAQGIFLFDSYLEAALTCFECGREKEISSSSTTIAEQESAALKQLAPAPLLSRKSLLFVLDKTAEELGRVRFSNEGQRQARLDEFTYALKRTTLVLDRLRAKREAAKRQQENAEQAGTTSK
jgi:hypothetical protein